MRGVTGMSDRYDRLAERYERWWAPVLAPTARGLLDDLAPLIERQPDARIVDVGTGTGTLALELVRRHPRVEVTAVDASRGMLAEARAQARRLLDRAAVRRLDFHRAEADELRLPEASFDAVVSSFVFQLVPDRFAAFREARRVLRPGGTLAVLAWMTDDTLFEPDEALEDAIDELRLEFDDDPPGDRRSGNFPSGRAAAAQARRAGFGEVRAVERELVHPYDPATYLDFLEAYAEQDLFGGLDRVDRDRLREATRRRLERLRPEEFVWRTPVVTVVGRRSA
jgi:ubiquinone/menaquinone biosynthesis C-methylase UbiE